MGANERTVKHLRMRACSEAQLRSTLLKLEDALRCATLPDAATRVLLVRRLNLGVFAPDASPQTLSRLLEQRVAAAGGVWKHGAATDASGADFVCFRDRLEARSELALRLARKEPCAAWYWPLAVPEFEPAQSAPSNLCRIARAIAALPEAAAALPAWIAHLAAAGAAPALAQAITPAEGAELLRAAQRPLNAHSRQPPHSTSAPAPTRTPAPVATSAPQQRAANARATLPAWLQTLALAGGFTPREASVTWQAPRDTLRAGQASRMSAAQRAPDFVRARADSPRRETTPNSSEPPYPYVVSVAAAAPPGAELHAPVTATAYGGLLFMLPVLQRLAYPTWADTLPDSTSATMVRELLALILHRLQAPADDPAWLLARPSAGDDNNHRDPEIAAHAQRWLTACRRWLRRQARIGVASLVRRPAALELSATHAAVHFRLSDIDIRVRRAGLDIDPGWLPWYGRVIAFHYTAPHNSGYALGG